MKVAILGYSGSGKSTLAKQLADYWQVPVLYLDTVQFLPGWAERSTEEGSAIVSDFLENNGGWVIDGNYRKFLQKERLEQADRIVILSFPRLLCFFRAWKRFLRNKNKTRESMATGCTEKMDREFMRWILWEGRTKKRRQSYQDVAARYPEKTIILKNPRQVAQFVSRIFTGESPETFRVG